MGNDRCLFCRIIEEREPADFILESEDFVAIWDKYPKAPVHALIVPRLHMPSLEDISSAQPGFCKRMLEFVVAVAAKLDVTDPGYRVITNVGPGGGQVIFHLHWHLLAGRPVGFDIREEL
jgi:histidine triad (HIT) family protein